MKTMARVKLVWCAFAVVFALVAAGGDLAAQAKKKKKMSDRVADLENQIVRIDQVFEELHGTEPPEKLRERQQELKEKLEGMLEELEALTEREEEVAGENEERDARIDALAEEVTDLWSEVEEHKKDIEKLKANQTAGYDGGFFIASDDGKHRLTANGFVRPYYQLQFQKVWNTDPYGRLVYTQQGNALRPTGGDTEITGNGFGVANMRLQLQMQLFKMVRAGLEIDYGTLNGQVEYPVNAYYPNGNVPNGAAYNRVRVHEHSLQFLDAYAEFAPLDAIQVRLGQFAVPFDRESHHFVESGFTFTTGSLMSRRYPRWGEGVPEDTLTYGYDYEWSRGSSFGYDRGLQIAGSLVDGIFKYNLGVFNGGGPNVGNDNRDVLAVLRLESDFLGPMTPGQSDLRTDGGAPLFSLGAAVAYDLPQHRDPVDPLLTYNSSDVNVTGDAHFKAMGLSVMAAIFFRAADHGAVFKDEAGKDVPINSLGFSGQLAYFNAASGLEPAFRYSFYDADVDRESDNIHEFTAGLAYHPFPEVFKLQLEWRGLMANDKSRSYMAPWGSWFEDRHELTLAAQVAF